MVFSWFGLLSPFGGDERIRTDDPLLAKQVLSQLSYTPISQGWDSAEGSPSIPLKT